MATFVIKPSQLSGALRGAEAGARRAVDRGIMRAAQRGKRRLIQATNEKEIPYLGQFKNSFQVTRQVNGTTVLLNDAPHAGIVELGARPHPVSEEGIQAITEWVKVKLAEELGPRRSPQQKAGRAGPLTPWADSKFSAAGGIYDRDAEARRIAEAIARKIRRHGQRGRFVFKDELPLLTKYLAEEVKRSIAEEAAKGPRRPRGGRP